MVTHSQDTTANRSERQPEHTDSERSWSGLRRAGGVVLGSLLLFRGLRRRSLRGVLTALVGAGILYRAVGGSLTNPLGGAGQHTGRPTDSPAETDRAVTVSRSITIDRPAEELYEMWQDPQQLSRILGHFADVVAVGTEGHRWIVHGPGGREVSWQTRTIADEPGERVRWATAPDASVHNEGTVRFHEAAGDRGTRVTLSVSFDPPGGTIGTAALKRLDVVPEALVGEALDRFKSLAESGEIPTLDENPSARGAGDLV